MRLKLISQDILGGCEIDIDMPGYKNWNNYNQPVSLQLLPASGVMTDKLEENGPIPILVDAATLNVYI